MNSIVLLTSCLLILAFIQSASAIQALNTTAKSDIVVCTYPISGQYGTFPRILYYVSIIFAIIARHNEWLVAGALISAMVYSSTAVIHAIVILATQGTNPHVIDLDILAITVMLLSGTLLFGPIMDFSDTVRRSEGRPIVALWGIWIWIGTFICLITGWNSISEGPNPTESHGSQIPTIPPKSSEVICLSTNVTVGNVLESASQLQNKAFNCTYDCLSSRESRIRGADEILAVPQAHIYTVFFSCIWVLSLVGTLLGLFGLIIISSGRKTWAERKKKAKENDAKVKEPMRMYSKTRTGSEVDAHRLLRLYNCILALMSISTIILGEIYLLKGGRVPKGEEYYAIGQWQPPLAAAFVIFAALVDRYLLNHEESTSQKPARHPSHALTGYLAQNTSDEIEEQPLALTASGAASSSPHRTSHESEINSSHGPTSEGPSSPGTGGVAGEVV